MVPLHVRECTKTELYQTPTVGFWGFGFCISLSTLWNHSFLGDKTSHQAFLISTYPSHSGITVKGYLFLNEVNKFKAHDFCFNCNLRKHLDVCQCVPFGSLWTLAGIRYQRFLLSACTYCINNHVSTCPRMKLNLDVLEKLCPSPTKVVAICSAFLIPFYWKTWFIQRSEL